MSVTLQWDGLEEYLAEIRQLPDDLTAEASSIVQRAAADHAQDVRGNYQAHRRTGNLANGVRVEARVMGPYGVGMVVKSTAKHAHIFEIGTQARHTDIGANRGSMPPGHAFVPPAIRRRRQMYDELIALVRGRGLEVTGP